MKIKDKIKSYSFWVSLASAVILILKVLGNRFGFTVDETMVSDLFTALCSVLVLLGIIVVPNNSNTQSIIQHDTTKSLDNNNNLKQTADCLDNKSNITYTQDENPNETIDNTHLNNETKIFIQQDFQEIETNSDNCSSENITTTLEAEQIIYEDENLNDLDNNHDEEISSKDLLLDDVHVKITDNNLSTNNSRLDEVNESITTQSISNTLTLKELFNAEREKFAQNINEYIFELQEEIRKAREKM